MKTTILLLLTTLSLQASTHTLWHKDDSYDVRATNVVVEVKAGEVYRGLWGHLHNGWKFYVNGPNGYRLGGATGFTIVGPCTITAEKVSLGEDTAALPQWALTYEITHDTFPPDKTIIKPAGQGLWVELECSADLINWTTAQPGAYTNSNSHLFFRLKGEPL